MGFRKGGHHSRRSQRSQRSYEESTAHRSSDALDGAQPPRGMDFETRRQFYAAELEKTLDSPPEEGESRDDSAIPSNASGQSASGGASPASQAILKEERQEGSASRLSSNAGPDAFPSQDKVNFWPLNLVWAPNTSNADRFAEGRIMPTDMAPSILEITENPQKQPFLDTLDIDCIVLNLLGHMLHMGIKPTGAILLASSLQ